MATPDRNLYSASELKSIKADCIAQMRNELKYAEDFIVAVEDCAAYEEYKSTLTHKELRDCFAKANAC